MSYAKFCNLSFRKCFVNNAAPRPGQQRRDHQADALAAARRREAQHMLRPVMAEIFAAETAQHDTHGTHQSGRPDLAPQCAPLLATSQELSRRFADDHEMLENAMPVYDSLYAGCRK